MLEADGPETVDHGVAESLRGFGRGTGFGCDNYVQVEAPAAADRTEIAVPVEQSAQQILGSVAFDVET